MTKGDDTRDEILRAALDQASKVGLEALSIGGLASDVGMSKSGLFAHFGSKLDLQIAVLDRAADLFTTLVWVPAVREPRGEPRIRALFDNWRRWTARAELEGGCVLAAAASEYDDRPGPVRDHTATVLGRLENALAKSAVLAVEAGHFRADLDANRFAFELHGILLAHNLHARLIGSHGRADELAAAAFESLLARSRV